MNLRLIFAAGLAITTAIACERVAHAEEPQARPAEGTRLRPAFAFAGGATSLRLLRLPFSGGVLRAGIAAETSEHVSLSADLEYVRAATDHGLVMQLARLEFTPTFVVGRLRVGAGPHLTLLVIDREAHGGAIRNLGVGAHATLGVDLVRLGARGAFFLSIKPSIATMGPASLYAAAAALGIRF